MQTETVPTRDDIKLGVWRGGGTLNFPTALSRAPMSSNSIILVVGASNMNRSQTNKTPLPNQLYVDVPTITKTTSRLIFLVCVFALAVWGLTGFVMIHPIIAIMTGIGSIGFYIMGSMAAKIKS